MCTLNEHCENGFARGLRADTLVCNHSDGISSVVGRCVRESRLLRRLGAECDPKQDRCDARRSLTCHPIDNDRHVCQHRNSRFDDFLVNHCDPQGRFNRCTGEKTRQECRLERTVTGTKQRFDPSPFFQCLRRSEIVSRGGVCLTEFTVYANGTECREVPGVLADGFQLPRFHPPKVAFCLSLIQEGESCGGVTDKFTTHVWRGCVAKMELA